MRILLLLLLALVGRGALNAATARSALDYKRAIWGSDDGAPAHIRAITQTRDGYLLLGADSGLYRFDGSRFTLVPALNDGTMRSERIEELLTARNGDVWIGYYYGGVAVYRAGHLINMNGSPPSGMARSIAEAGDGSIWVAAVGRKMPNLRRFKDGRWIDAAAVFGLPAEAVVHVLGTRDGSVWVATTRHVYVLRTGGRHFEQSAAPALAFAGGTVGLVEDLHGQVWLSDQLGLRPILPPGRPLARPARPFLTDAIQPLTYLIADTEGALWNADATRIIRIAHPEDARSFGEAVRGRITTFNDDKDSVDTLSIFEDREGTIWIGTLSGLVSLRPSSVMMHPISSTAARSEFRFATDSSGHVFGLSGEGVFQFDGRNGVTNLSRIAVSPNGLCTAGRDGFWIKGHDNLVHLQGAKVRTVTPPAAWRDYVNSACAEDDQGRVWVSVAHIGVMRWDGRTWAHVPVIPGDPTDFPGNIVRQPDGDILMTYTSWHIAEVRGDTVHVDKLGAPNTPGIMTFIYKNGRDIFTGSDSGVARVTDGRARLVTSARFPWVKNARGMTQTNDGWTWLAGSLGVARVPTRAFLASFDDPSIKVPVRVFGPPDGLNGTALPFIGNSLLTDTNQTVWVSTDFGLAKIVPAMVVENKAAPPILIEKVSVDGRALGSLGSLRLPAGSRNIRIDYTGLSLADPRRVQFRYRLEGFDKNWIDPEGRRQAIYSALQPGTYRFQVIASNNDGVWNTKGASVTLLIPPTFRQSWWFVALWVLLVGVLFWVLYALRLRQATERMRQNEQARIAERERIARDLHDTLLQSLQGLILRFQSIATRIPRDQPARTEMEEALQRADAVVVEGRDSVYDLRTPPPEIDFVGQVGDAIAKITLPQHISIDCEGRPRPLSSAVGDELVQIVLEAVRNAARHSQGRTIAVRIAFARRTFGITIADDGVGIDVGVAANGRVGHYGLTGMRERAARVRARFDIRPGSNGGTVVGIRIRAGLAYADLRWWQK